MCPIWKEEDEARERQGRHRGKMRNDGGRSWKRAGLFGGLLFPAPAGVAAFFPVRSDIREERRTQKTPAEERKKRKTKKPSYGRNAMEAKSSYFPWITVCLVLAAHPLVMLVVPFGVVLFVDCFRVCMGRD